MFSTKPAPDSED